MVDGREQTIGDCRQMRPPCREPSHVAGVPAWQGWIELGQDEYSSSLVRALDEGGMVWEGSANYGTLDEAFDALETDLAEWMEQIT